MTLESTVEYFREMVQECGAYELCPCDKDDMEMTKIALNALEKQIPKKPALEGDGYDDNGELIYDTWICPNCEEHYEVDYDIYDYCPKCGQAIDRSGME